jgi:hypothetical protein
VGRNQRVERADWGAPLLQVRSQRPVAIDGSTRGTPCCSPEGSGSARRFAPPCARALPFPAGGSPSGVEPLGCHRSETTWLDERGRRWPSWRLVTTFLAAATAHGAPVSEPMRGQRSEPVAGARFVKEQAARGLGWRVTPCGVAMSCPVPAAAAHCPCHRHRSGPGRCHRLPHRLRPRRSLDPARRSEFVHAAPMTLNRRKRSTTRAFSDASRPHSQIKAGRSRGGLPKKTIELCRLRPE